MLSKDQELWLPVPGYEGLYEVSDRGHVRSLDRWTGNRFFAGRTLKGNVTRFGYVVVGLSNNGDLKHRKIHCLMMEAFVGPKTPGIETAHFDGNRSNNILSNLRYDTRKGNHADRKRHGTDLRGTTNPRSVLNEDMVRQIRRMKGRVPQKVIAEFCGVGIGAVKHVHYGTSWAWLDA